MKFAREALMGAALGWTVIGSSPAMSATFLVETPFDNLLPGSLRTAVTLANLTPTAQDTVFFELGPALAIELGSPLPTLSTDITFDGRASPFPGVKGPSGAPWLDVGSQTASWVEVDLEGGTVTIGNGGALEIERNRDLALDVAITGAGELVKRGTGLLTLLEPASHTGGTRIEAGRMRGDTQTLLGNFQIEKDAVLEFRLPLDEESTENSGNPVFYLNSLSGGGALVMSGSDDANLILTGTNLHTGGTTVENGTLVAAAPQFLPGDVQIEDGASFGLVVSGDATRSGILSGPGTFQKTGPGNLTLTGANALTGTLQIDAGTLIGTSGSLSGDVVFAVAGTRLVFDQESDGTFSGDVSGAGQIEKTGAGRLTLEGVTSHTGGTQVNQGTLRGTASSLGSGIELAAGTILEFDQNSDGTFSDVITADNTASLRKLGEGRLTLTSDQSYTGAFEVLAGRLELEAQLAGGVEVAEGGTLGGTGEIQGDLIAQGAVAPSDFATPLNVQNATFEAGSELRIQLNDSAPDASTKLEVLGTATLLGGQVVVDAEPGTYSAQPSLTYVVLESADSSGTFDGTLDEFAFLNFSLSTVTNPGDHRVNLTVSSSVDEVGNYADTINQQAVAEVLGEAFAGADSDFDDQVKPNLTVVRNDEVGEVLDSIGGDALSAPFSVRLANQRRFRDLLTQRFAVLAEGGAATQRPSANSLRKGSFVPAPGFRTTSPGLPPAGARGPTSLVTRDGDRQVGAWLDAFGVFGSLDGGNQGAAGIDLEAFGPVAGVDLRVSDGWFAGAAVGYSRGSFDSRSRTSQGDLDIAQAALYGGFASPSLQLAGTARYAYAAIDSRRNIAFSNLQRTARAEFSGSDVSLSAEGAWTFTGPSGMNIQPLAGFDWNHLTQDAFDETGAGSLDLQVASQTVNSLISTVGLRVSRYYLSSDYLSLLPEISVAWLHEFGDTERAVQARLSGVTSGGNFTVFGAETARDSAQIGAGWQAQLTDRAAMSIHYDARVGSDFLNHAIAFTLYASW
ncbi:autotransporter domain-containing protein [Myxococcota bacterium]|nr:autotransporter domain-containing protein [Myxococcota bacterium]